MAWAPASVAQSGCVKVAELCLPFGARQKEARKFSWHCVPQPPHCNFEISLGASGTSHLADLGSPGWYLIRNAQPSSSRALWPASPGSTSILEAPGWAGLWSLQGPRGSQAVLGLQDVQLRRLYPEERGNQSWDTSTVPTGVHLLPSPVHHSHSLYCLLSSPCPVGYRHPPTGTNHHLSFPFSII